MESKDAGLSLVKKAKLPRAEKKTGKTGYAGLSYRAYKKRQARKGI